MDDDRESLAKQVEAQVGVRPPEALLDVWTGERPVDAAADVSVYGPDEIAERNRTYEIPDYAPDLLLIGDDGGGAGLFVARNDSDPEVVLIGLGAVGTVDGTPAGQLSLLAADGFRSIDSAEDLGDTAASTGPIDVLVTHRPGVRALVEIRKLFHLSLPISALTAADAHYPMVVLTDVHHGRYAEAIAQLNLRHRCLAVRPHVTRISSSC
ncbi:hypothetical protein AB0C01_33820 [Micromonospora sp. NPDC048905]|uniref:hypothetical protein n=1 Tax=Micromonospora sp. NPDC048905 TaxID=3155494 RepID=UPI0033CCC8E4